MMGLDNNGFAELRWQRAEVQLERRQVPAELEQPRQRQRQSPLPSEVSIKQSRRYVGIVLYSYLIQPFVILDISWRSYSRSRKLLTGIISSSRIILSSRFNSSISVLAILSVGIFSCGASKEACIMSLSNFRAVRSISA